MSKEYLEALERLVLPDVLHIKVCEKLGIGLAEDYDLIKQALLELKAIKEANPSEALECLEEMYKLCTPQRTYHKLNVCNNTIKQALLKTQEQEKVLKIIFKKRIDFEVFGAFETYEDYEIYYNNRVRLINHKLTQEEFDTLKRYYIEYCNCFVTISTREGD